MKAFEGTGLSNKLTNTYVAGEDMDRLQRAARSLGLASTRSPMTNVRAAVRAIFEDTTLEAAMMHSVGALGHDEHIDTHGTIHIRTLTRRRHRRTLGKGSNTTAIAGDTPKYGALSDLFQQQQTTPSQETEPLNQCATRGLCPLEGAEEEIDEMVEEDAVEGGSIMAAVFGIIKGTVGPAILYLPRGFSLAGWGVGILAMLLATASYLYSAFRLLQCWKAEKVKMEKLEEIRAILTKPSMPTENNNNKLDTSWGSDYGSIDRDGESQVNESPKYTQPTTATLLTYPELARRAFGKSSIFVQVGIAAMQFGVCLTYFIFVPQNLVESVKELFGVYVDKIVFLIVMVAVEIPLSWITDIRKLTPTNILATLLIAYGLLSCLIIAVFHSEDEAQENYSSLAEQMHKLPVANRDTWFLFVGTSFFVFEGSITLLVPLQEAVFRKEDKDRFPVVNAQVTSWIVVFYIFFAVTCWAAFGDSIKTALTASLPPSIFSTIVQFAYSVAVILTFPLQAFPAMDVFFHACSCRSRRPDFGDNNSAVGRKSIWQRNAVASFIICLLGFVAYISIDYLGNVVSLLGSLVGIPIALIFPPLMHNQLVCSSVGYVRKATRWMNLCVAGVGVLAMALTSYTTITSWEMGAEE